MRLILLQIILREILHDTFYLTDGHLLRTHTSPVQIRSMENQKPPVRDYCAGKSIPCGL